jgi:hypothetical protein
MASIDWICPGFRGETDNSYLEGFYTANLAFIQNQHCVQVGKNFEDNSCLRKTLTIREFPPTRLRNQRKAPPLSIAQSTEPAAFHL